MFYGMNWEQELGAGCWTPATAEFFTEVEGFSCAAVVSIMLMLVLFVFV